METTVKRGSIEHQSV